MGFVKTKSEIETMRKGGKIMAEILTTLKDMIKPGLDTWDLETEFINLCSKYKVNPTCKGYSPYGMPPFPTGLCLSINNQSVHCFPIKGRLLNEGDVATVDTVIELDGLNLDSAFCTIVGKTSDEKKLKLVKVANESLYGSINEIADGKRVGHISHKLQKIVESQGLNVLKDFSGHGIGKEMHEYPEIPCYGDKNEGPKLRSGMTICVEALVCTGDDQVLSVSPWETKMADGCLFAQSEHTVLVTDNGFEILTK